MDSKLIIALDVDSLAKAKQLITKLYKHVRVFKVGSQLFTACGPEVISYIKKKKCEVFLDLKFFDIPNTVEKAVLAAAAKGVFMVTLHATGGRDMLKRASASLRGKRKRPLLVGVTVLTSKNASGTSGEVLRLAGIAKKCGLDGIVCSPEETEPVKKEYGRKFLVINPGIRPRWAVKNDQKRIATPRGAIRKGCDFLVIGRPVIKARDPVVAVKKILNEMDEAKT